MTLNDERTDLNHLVLDSTLLAEQLAKQVWRVMCEQSFCSRKGPLSVQHLYFVNTMNNIDISILRSQYMWLVSRDNEALQHIDRPHGVACGREKGSSIMVGASGQYKELLS